MGTLLLAAPSAPLATAGASLALRRPRSSFVPATRLSPRSSRITLAVRASSASSPAAPVADSPSKSGAWRWKYESSPVNVYYEEYGSDSSANTPKILMLPSISDTSTVEEWRSVAKNIVTRKKLSNCSVTIVDWPGLGFSDRPAISYNADVLENFLIELLKSPEGPVSSSGDTLVILGAGHAATLAVRAAKKRLIQPLAIAAVAPTWSGPLPIVFGRSSEMESRYGLLRGILKAPAVGGMMYTVLVSNEKAIRSQYESHVYADSRNVTPDLVKCRYELTKKKGARFVPAAFLTGLLDPVGSRAEFLELFSGLEGSVPVVVMSGASGPKRSKAEMEALRGSKGVCKFVEVPGALLPQEEYPDVVSEELCRFLEEQLILKLL